MTMPWCGRVCERFWSCRIHPPAHRSNGEAANGIEAVELAKKTQPDIILLDLVMPEMDGLQATPKIIKASPHSRVIILTSFGEEDKVLRAIRAGA